MKLVPRKTLWILMGILLYTGGVAYFSLCQYYANKNDYLARADQKLENSVKVVAGILARKFQNKPNYAQEGSPERKLIAAELAQLSNDLGVYYLYAFTLKDDLLLLTTSSQSGSEQSQIRQEFQHFFQQSPTPLPGKTLFQNISHGNRVFRLARFALASPHTQVQWIGAEIPWQKLKLGLDEIFLESLLTTIYLMLLILPIIFLHHMLIKRQFHTDALTRLPNRKQLNLDLSHSIDVMLILLKIDRFSEINDFYGCSVGDFILWEFSRRCQKSVPKSCRVFRIRYNEFAILSPNTLAQKGYVTLGSILLEAYLENLKRDPYRHENVEMHIEVTAGVANGTKNIIQKASMALKAAKLDHKPYILFSSSMKLMEESEKNIGWRTKLRDGIKAGIITTHYRPVVSNQTGQVELYDCQARLNDGKNTSLPQQVLALARKYKLNHFITKKVIEETFEKFRGSNHKFIINLSVGDFFNNQTRNLLITNLRRDPIPERVIISLMDMEMKPKYSIIKTEISWIKRLGALIAIDNFGAGVTNLKCLFQLPIDLLKLDASIIKLISVQDARRHIPKAVVDISQKLGIETIAQSVQSETIFKAVKKIGIDYSQGEYIGKPSKIILQKTITK